MSYRLHLPGLEDFVSSLGSLDEIEHRLPEVAALDPVLARVRVAARSVPMAPDRERRRVVDRHGQLVADQYDAFLLAAFVDSGEPQEVAERFRPLGLRVTETLRSDVTLVSDLGGPQDHFVQVGISMYDERVDRLLIARPSRRHVPHDVLQLLEPPQRLCTLPEVDRTPFPRVHRLDVVANMARFIVHGLAVEQQRRALRRVAFGQRDGAVSRASFCARRFVDDWSATSAGLSGARLCRHWCFGIVDKPHELTLDRHVQAWARPVRFHARLEADDGSLATEESLLATLQAVDERAGVPMAWYFQMLAGSGLPPEAVGRALEAARQGRWSLPRHDQDVLSAWCEAPYAFDHATAVGSMLADA